MNLTPVWSVRDDQMEETRTRILDAAFAIIRADGEEAVTMARVAASAEVTERTVYRHFATRELLIQAIWDRQEGAIWEHVARTRDTLIETPRHMFPVFDQAPELARSVAHSRAALKARTGFKEERQQAMLECIRREVRDLDENSLRRRAAIIDLLTTPYAWEFMAQCWGLDGAEAGEAAAEAMEVLLGRRLAD